MPQARRGELWVIDLGVAQKPRPCLILSIVYLDHEPEVVSYVPRTTAFRSNRFEVPHHARGLEAGALDAQGIGSDLIVRLERPLGSVYSAIIQEVEAAWYLW